MRREAGPRAHRIHVRCFGELEVLRPGGSAVEPLLALPRRAALFLYLLLADHVDPPARDELARMFWGFEGPGAAAHMVDRSLFALRQYVGDLWELDGDAVVLLRDAVWCDVSAFRAAVAEEDVARAARLYRGPLLHRPPLFGGSDFQAWVEGERERLREDALIAYGRLARAEADDGRWDEAAETLRRAARAEPLDETVVRCRMVALVRAGRRREALRTFQLLRQRLVLRHSRRPERETTALADVIRSGAAPPLEPFLPG